jgi:hypothetical protein
MEALGKVTLCDSTTGEFVEVVAGLNGKLFHIEGFSWDFIRIAQKTLNDNRYNSCAKCLKTKIIDIPSPQRTDTSTTLHLHP